jgi:hypothetical protein
VIAKSLIDDNDCNANRSLGSFVAMARWNDGASRPRDRGDEISCERAESEAIEGT